MKQDKKPPKIVMHPSATLRKPDFSRPEKLKARFKAEPRFADFGGLDEKAVAEIHSYIDRRAALLLQKKATTPSRPRRPPVGSSLAPFTVSFPTLGAAKDFGSNLATKLEAQLQREATFFRENGCSKQNMKQHIAEQWVEHDILDAELELKRPARGAILLIARQADGRYTLQLLSRKET